MSFLSDQAKRGAKGVTRINKPTPAGEAALEQLDKVEDQELSTETPFDSLPFNQKAAKILEAIGQYLSQQGEDTFRVGAYDRAAATIRAQGPDLSTWSAKELQKLPSVGKSTATKVREIADTGTCQKYAELAASSPPDSVAELEKLPGVGPVNALRIWKETGVDSLAALGVAIEKGEITDTKLVQGFEFVNKELERVPLGMILPFVREFMSMVMKQHRDIVERISVAGSTRRGRETVRDIDVLICVAEQHVPIVQQTIIREFSEHGAEAAGENKCRLLYIQDILKVQVDVLFTPPVTWGSKLLYFTGSKEFNIATRRRAKAIGYTLNEYGLWNGEECIASKTEEAILNALQIAYVQPWQREQNVANIIDRDTQSGKYRSVLTQDWVKSEARELQMKHSRQGWEVEDPQDRSLPLTTVVAEQQIALYEYLGGSLHNHCIFATKDGKQWDDGRIRIGDLIIECKRRGMKYVGIASHSKSLPIARGLSEDALKQQIEHVRENEWDPPLCIGSEMEVKSDGSFDWSEEILSELDFVIAALHMQPGKNTTERIVAAMQHPKVCMIAHPTGRVFAERPIAEADWDVIFKAAIDTNTALELNVQSSRADLPEDLLSRAIAAGVKIAINCDVHRLVDFDSIVLGPLMFNRAGGTVKDLFQFEEWWT